jgi:hypothetical protein
MKKKKDDLKTEYKEALAVETHRGTLAEYIKKNVWAYVLETELVS